MFIEIAFSNISFYTGVFDRSSCVYLKKNLIWLYHLMSTIQ